MTLIHLSYVKLLVNVINIFSFLKVFVEKLSTHQLQIAYLWYSDASIPYGSTWGHVCLIILTVIFTCVFLIPYLLLSLFTPCCWRWRLVIRFRPVFETLYEPYKHKYAYWQICILVWSSSASLNYLCCNICCFSGSECICSTTIISDYFNTFCDSSDMDTTI